MMFSGESFGEILQYNLFKLPFDAGRVTPAERILPLGDHGAEQVVSPNQVRALITHEALERGIESMESL